MKLARRLIAALLLIGCAFGASGPDDAPMEQGRPMVLPEKRDIHFRLRMWTMYRTCTAIPLAHGW